MTTYLNRADWTDTARPTDLTRLVGPKGFALHWPGTTEPIGSTSHDAMASRLEGYRRFHVDVKGWADIAYQTGIDQDGRVWDLRGTYYRSAANGSTLTNASWGAVLLLVGPGEQLTPALEQAVRDYRANIWLPRFPGAGRVVGHQDVRPEGTECPGPAVTAAIAAGTFTTIEQGEDTMPTAEEIAAAIWAYPVGKDADGTPVTAGKALKRLSENSVRGGVRDVYALRLLAEIAPDGAVTDQLLGDAESVVFPNEGAVIGEPVRPHPNAT